MLVFWQEICLSLVSALFSHYQTSEGSQRKRYAKTCHALAPRFRGGLSVNHKDISAAEKPSECSHRKRKAPISFVLLSKRAHLYHIVGSEPHLTTPWAISLMWKTNYDVSEARLQSCQYVDSLPLWVVKAGSRPCFHSQQQQRRQQQQQQRHPKLSHSFHAHH